MADVQPENGYTKIANDLQVALCATKIPGTQRQIFDTIIAFTWTFQRRSATIALSQFCDFTGLSQPHVCRAIRELKSKNMIEVTKGIAKNGTAKNGTPHSRYAIQKDFEAWKSLPKMALPKMAHSKDIYIYNNKNNISNSSLESAKNGTAKNGNDNVKEKLENYMWSFGQLKGIQIKRYSTLKNEIGRRFTLEELMNAIKRWNDYYNHCKIVGLKNWGISKRWGNFMDHIANFLTDEAYKEYIVKISGWANQEKKQPETKKTNKFSAPPGRG